MEDRVITTKAEKMSLPSRGAWIEITSKGENPMLKASLPSRGAWIEIVAGIARSMELIVAPLTGSVD